MKDKKNIILIAVLAVAIAAAAAVVVLTMKAKTLGPGTEPETTTEEPTTPEQTPAETEPETTEPQIVNPEPYVQEGEAHVIDENSQVLYGWYPYTLMENGISGLEAAEYNDDNITEIDGTRYMRVAREEGYDYYRFEMIKWDIYMETATEYILISSQVIDCMPYNDSFDMASWEKSSLSSWLNGFFYSEAFSDEERAGIKQTELGANRNPIYGTITGGHLLTNIYLAAAENLLDPACGYDPYVQTEDPKRMCQPTPFAEARGVHAYSDGYCKWWTRTNGVEESYAVFVNSNGLVGCDGSFVNSDGYGVRPMMNVSKEMLQKKAEGAE